jgi:hypothetical protein
VRPHPCPRSAKPAWPSSRSPLTPISSYYNYGGLYGGLYARQYNKVLSSDQTATPRT